MLLTSGENNVKDIWKKSLGGGCHDGSGVQRWEVEAARSPVYVYVNLTPPTSEEHRRRFRVISNMESLSKTQHS